MAKDDDAFELVGSLFNGRYQIERALSQGAYGQVFVATDKQVTQRRLALKILKYDDGGRGYKDVTRKAFLRETRTMALLRDRNTVQIYEAGEGISHTGERLLYIAMEHVDGVSLSRFRKNRGRIEARELAGIIEDIATSLHEAHGKGMIHRDLKPENIMVLPEDPGSLRRGVGIKVLDFGIAKAFQAGGALDMSLTKTGMIKGSPRFMAREQFEGDASHFGPWTDIYALGIIAHECLTGTNPTAHFKKQSDLFRWLLAGKEDLAVPPPHQGTPFGDVVDRMTRRDHLERFKSCKDLVEALRRIDWEGREAGRDTAAYSSEAFGDLIGNDTIEHAPTTDEFMRGETYDEDVDTTMPEVEGPLSREPTVRAMAAELLTSAPARPEGSPATLKLPSIGARPELAATPLAGLPVLDPPTQRLGAIGVTAPIDQDRVARALASDSQMHLAVGAPGAQAPQETPAPESAPSQPLPAGPAPSASGAAPTPQSPSPATPSIHDATTAPTALPEPAQLPQRTQPAPLAAPQRTELSLSETVKEEPKKSSLPFIGLIVACVLLGLFCIVAGVMVFASP